MLDGAVSAGANTAGGVRFEVKDTSKLQTEALNAALKDARAQADVVAAGLGLKVNGVQSATVDSTGGSGPIYVTMAAAPKGMGAADTPVEPGEMTISAVVRVTFGFSIGCSYRTCSERSGQHPVSQRGAGCSF